jgi:hypothetical protein
MSCVTIGNAVTPALVAPSHPLEEGTQSVSNCTAKRFLVCGLAPFDEAEFLQALLYVEIQICARDLDAGALALPVSPNTAGAGCCIAMPC